MLIVLRREEYPRDELGLANWQASPDFGVFVDRLADGIKNGYHALEAPGRLLEWLSTREEIGRAQRLAFQDAFRWNSQRLVNFGAASHALLLTGPLGEFAVPTERHTVWIRRDWRWLASDLGKLPQAFIFAENHSDALLYVWAARAMSVRLSGNRIGAEDEVSLLCAGGGGSTTGQNYAAQVVQGSPAICVVDTDKEYDGDNFGQTAEVALGEELELSKRCEVPPHAVVILDAYTVENVLPLELLTEACSSTDWLEPMVQVGFFLRLREDDGDVRAGAWIDPALKYIRPKRWTELQLLTTKEIDKSTNTHEMVAIRNPDLLAYREGAIARIRLNKPDVVEPIVFGCGKPLAGLLGKLEDFRNYRDRPGNYSSAAHWLCCQLLSSPDAFVEEWETVTFVKEWEPVARAVWSWGLRFPARIRVRNTPD